MTNWQVTATTIYCDAVDEDVTLMVFKDWTAKCVSQKRFHNPDKETARILSDKGNKLGRKLGCDGPECKRVIQYRDKLSDEEISKTAPER